MTILVALLLLSELPNQNVDAWDNPSRYTLVW